MATETSTPDPFAVLGLEPRFDLERQALEERFRERSREVHPDRFVGAPAAARTQALISTRALNDAYQVLRHPQRRAEVLLAQHGVVIGDREVLEPAFLAEILELREELADARVAGDLATVTRLAGVMRARQRALLDQVAAQFARVAAGATDALAAIKRDLITLRYVDRYLDECDAATDDE
ncbi:MAG: Fe-S protein assembly co-chaperone HscB [Kofleriaceae bacterium]